jgi:hypothetical protein
MALFYHHPPPSSTLEAKKDPGGSGKLPGLEEEGPTLPEGDAQKPVVNCGKSLWGLDNLPGGR